MSLDISLHQKACYNTEVYNANITHNLGSMADNVICFFFHLRDEKPKSITLYNILWHGSGQSAKVIAPMLEVGLKELIENEGKFLFENNINGSCIAPKNGWGSYETLINFTNDLLEACKKYPETTLYCNS